MKTIDRRDSEAYRRILDTASDLFYRNGYRATGINEIIEKSKVAKATFYAHFPSKEALALAYVRAMNENDLRATEAGLEKFPGPYEKLLGLLEYSIDWSKQRDYRGCAYLNIASELPDPSNPVRLESQNRYRNLRTLIGRLTRELKARRGAAWKDRDLEPLADSYMLLLAGALALSPLYRDPKPFRDALAAAKRLLS